MSEHSLEADGGWAIPVNVRRRAAGLPELPGERVWRTILDPVGSTGDGPARSGPGIPSDDRIASTLDSAGYPPPAQVDGVSPYVLELAQHPAVLRHGQGMTPADLASFTEALASLAQSRTRGVGAEQYYNGTGQRFEGMSPYQIAEYALEEFADVMNYSAMSAIKVLAAVRAMEVKNAV